MFCVNDVAALSLWQHILHFILFEIEITFDKINHATNINLTQDIISVEHFVVYSSSCF